MRHCTFIFAWTNFRVFTFYRQLRLNAASHKVKIGSCTECFWRYFFVSPHKCHVFLLVLFKDTQVDRVDGKLPANWQKIPDNLTSEFDHGTRMRRRVRVRTLDAIFFIKESTCPKHDHSIKLLHQWMNNWIKLKGLQPNVISLFFL